MFRAVSRIRLQDAADVEVSALHREDVAIAWCTVLALGRSGEVPAPRTV